MEKVEPSKRGLHSVELFAGRMEIARALMGMSLRSVASNKNVHSDDREDITTVSTFTHC